MVSRDLPSFYGYLYDYELLRWARACEVDSHRVYTSSTAEAQLARIVLLMAYELQFAVSTCEVFSFWDSFSRCQRDSKTRYMLDGVASVRIARQDSVNEVHERVERRGG